MNPIQPTENAAGQPTSNNGVFKMDDFLNKHQAEHDAQMAERAAAQASKQASTPSTKASTNKSAVIPAPVALGARSSKYTVLLHQKYQALGILQPLFSFQQRVDSKWIAEVSFPGLESEERLQKLKTNGGSNSKQEAKEALSEQACEILEELERNGKVTKSRQSANKNVGEQQMKQTAGPNYIGQLLEFQRATASPEGIYQDYSVGTRFACQLTIEDFPTPFGALDSLHSSKKAARQDAARLAVEALKAKGVWPEDHTSTGGIKKKMVLQSNPSASHSSSSAPLPTSPGSEQAAGTSYAQQVAQLAVALSFPTPEWRFEPHPTDKDFVSVACMFRDAGAHEGPIGEVRNVYGKKKAKEECARLTLEYLKRVREARLQVAEGLVGDLVGGESVVQAGLGRLVEGEGEEAFEDAVEEMEMGG